MVARDTAYKHLRQTKLDLEEQFKQQCHAYDENILRIKEELKNVHHQLQDEKNRHIIAQEIIKTKDEKFKAIDLSLSEQQTEVIQQKLEVRWYTKIPSKLWYNALVLLILLILVVFL